MYYATYKNVGESDIAVFKTRTDRDNWVNFKDPYSVALGVKPEDCTFERMAIEDSQVSSRIKNMVHMLDEFNPQQEWYCEGD